MHDRRPNLSIIILFKLKCTAGERGWCIIYIRIERGQEFPKNYMVEMNIIL